MSIEFEVEVKIERLKQVGKLIIVCGLSGSGKTTLIREALCKIDKVTYLKTFTTRKPRSEDEKANSIEYIFVSQEQYQILKDRSQNWDHTDVYKDSYGADIDESRMIMNSGKNLLVASPPNLEIVNDLKQKYGSNTKVVLIDVSSQVTNGRLSLERNEIEQSRIEVDSKVNLDHTRQIADLIFIPTMKLKEDVIQFCRIINQLI